MQVAQAIERIDKGEDVEGAKAYKIDQLTAMKWSTEIWNKTSAATLQDCWQHIGLAPPIRDCNERDHSTGIKQDDGVQDLALLMELLSME